MALFGSDKSGPYDWNKMRLILTNYGPAYAAAYICKFFIMCRYNVGDSESGGTSGKMHIAEYSQGHINVSEQDALKEAIGSNAITTNDKAEYTKTQIEEIKKQKTNELFAQFTQLYPQQLYPQLTPEVLMTHAQTQAKAFVDALPKRKPGRPKAGSFNPWTWMINCGRSNVALITYSLTKDLLFLATDVELKRENAPIDSESEVDSTIGTTQRLHLNTVKFPLWRRWELTHGPIPHFNTFDCGTQIAVGKILEVILHVWSDTNVPITDALNDMNKPQAEWSDQFLEYRRCLKWLHTILVRLRRVEVIKVMCSNEGTGKSYLFEFIQKFILGNDCCLITSELKDVLGDFNSQLAGKLLVVFEETKRTAYTDMSDKMKHAITGERFRVCKKYQDATSVPNIASFAMLSNNHDIGITGRRVWENDVGSMYVTKGGKRNPYWDALAQIIPRGSVLSDEDMRKGENIGRAFVAYLRDYGNTMSDSKFSSLSNGQSEAKTQDKATYALQYLKEYWTYGISLVTECSGPLGVLYNSFCDWHRIKNEAKHHGRTNTMQPPGKDTFRRSLKTYGIEPVKELYSADGKPATKQERYRIEWETLNKIMTEENMISSEDEVPLRTFTVRAPFTAAFESFRSYALCHTGQGPEPPPPVPDVVMQHLMQQTAQPGTYTLSAAELNSLKTYTANAAKLVTWKNPQVAQLMLQLNRLLALE
jgi:hypothetical protein